MTAFSKTSDFLADGISLAQWALVEEIRGRKQFGINHRKWIDAANYLGCQAIRTNCRGPEKVTKGEALKWATETYNMLLEYAVPANVKVVIENHGGISNNGDWMVSLMKKWQRK